MGSSVVLDMKRNAARTTECNRILTKSVDEAVDKYVKFLPGNINF